MLASTQYNRWPAAVVTSHLWLVNNLVLSLLLVSSYMSNLMKLFPCRCSCVWFLNQCRSWCLVIKPMAWIHATAWRRHCSRSGRGWWRPQVKARYQLLFLFTNTPLTRVVSIENCLNCWTLVCRFFLVTHSTHSILWFYYYYYIIYPYFLLLYMEAYCLVKPKGSACLSTMSFFVLFNWLARQCFHVVMAVLILISSECLLCSVNPLPTYTSPQCLPYTKPIVALTIYKKYGFAMWTI